MQKLWDWRETENQVLHSRQNQGQNKINKSKLACWLKYKSAQVSYVSRTPRAFVPHVSFALRALMPNVPCVVRPLVTYVLSYPTCFVPCVFSCPTCLVPRVLLVLCPMCPCALWALFSCVPLVLVLFVLYVLISPFVLMRSYPSCPYFPVHFLLLISFLET